MATPGEITSLTFRDHGGGNPLTAVTANFIEGFNVTSEPDTYSSAGGFDVERGGVRKTLSCNIFDYSAYSTATIGLNARTWLRTTSEVLITYVGGSTRTLNNLRLKCTPLIHLVDNACTVMIGATDADNDNLDDDYAATTPTDWTSLGVTLGLPSPNFSFPFEGMDGCGRPFVTTGRVDTEFILPDATYSDLDSFAQSQARVAVRMPDGNWLVYENVYVFRHYADQDGSAPVSSGVRLRLTGVATNWTSLITWTDGATGGASAVTPSDYITGVAVEATGYGQVETDMYS